ncbi:hypothetical protein BJX76DRAFT_361149 [Aspergillus varians]
MASQRPQRRKAFTRRSRTGCRTCRVRHVKCDETPGGCRNCTLHGWTCGGYELGHRLPRRVDVHHQAASPVAPSVPVATGFCWAMTSDEKRCVSFFHYRTVASLTSYYDSSLWQKLVLQLSATEPAVFHAVVALSAVNQDMENHGTLMPWVRDDSLWHVFALEQAVRSFDILTKRHISQDPQLRTVILVCCLLFVMLDLVLGRPDDATAHLHSGLTILKEMKVQRRMVAVAAAPFEESLLEAFLMLESQATHYGILLPPLCIDSQLVNGQRYEAYLYEFRDLRDVQQAFNPLVNSCYPFLERCWERPEAEIIASHGALHAKQQRLLSCLHQFDSCFARYRHTWYHRLTGKEERGADLIKLMHFALLLSVKTALYPKRCPESVRFISDYEKVLAEALAVIEKFSGRPVMTVETSICPSLFLIGSRCPDYFVRLRAVDALRAWPHLEGYMNSTVIAELLIEGLKVELLQIWHGLQPTGSCPPAHLYFERRGDGEIIAHLGDRHGEEYRPIPLEPNKMMLDALMSIQSVQYWSCVRASGILPLDTNRPSY